LALTLAAACGDDTGSGGAGASGGSTTTTGSTSSSTKSSSSSTTSSSSSSSSSSSGGGGAAEGGGGGALGGGGAGQGGDGGAGGGGANPSQQIADVIATPDGAGLSLPIEGALVTYIKTVQGMDPAGFFLQAEQTGPAIFVAVDPATLNPVVNVGDELELTVTEVTTVAGLKMVTAVTGVSELSTGNSITPLVTDVSNANDLVTNLSGYESRVISLTADIDANFVNASFPQVAAEISTMGLDDPNLRLRMPETVRAAFDLEVGCSVTLDYGVMWRFNAVAQPSTVDAADLSVVLCPAPTVVSAAPTSGTTVVVSFSRLLDPASVQAADFTFNNGLTAQAVSVSGKDVTITTSMQTGGTTYTVTAQNLTDVLGSNVVAPNTAMFNGFVTIAQMVFNEISPNIGSARDLAEFLVTGAGTTNGITFIQDGSNVEILATFPDVTVAVGDLIVVHVNPAGATGAAPGSETTSKTQHPAATFSANYDNAWDFHGGNSGITNSNRVLRLEAPGGAIIDAIAVALTGQTTAAFPGDLATLQGLGLWLPANCGGVACDYASTPTAVDISVNYFGVGTTPTGNTVQRKPGFDTMQASDWNAAAAHSLGQPNP
jgi:hypothetical protein